jgi:hypothetical protein
VRLAATTVKMIRRSRRSERGRPPLERESIRA